MFKRLLLAALFSAASAGIASATPISGSFSLASFGGTYIGGSQTAQTATGLDFGMAFGSTGNGYGTNGTALVGNSTGSFAGLDGSMASIADIALAAFANPYATNPFISFGSNSAITVNFSDAQYTRSPLGTSVTVTGVASFSDGIAADASTGMFSLSLSSQGGQSSSAQFTYSGNASVTEVPEPASLALLGASLLAVGAVRSRRQRATDLA
ncbi:MAG: PEP-CTERM sorting domain-containing protein [Janthinobacterium lividum]